MKHFISIDNQEYRVEANFNAIGDALQIMGKPMSYLQKFDQIGINDIITLIWAAISEGERLEGRGFDKSMKDLGAIIGPDDIESFLTIFTKQWSGEQDAEGSNAGGSKKKINWFSRK